MTEVGCLSYTAIIYGLSNHEFNAIIFFYELVWTNVFVFNFEDMENILLITHVQKQKVIRWMIKCAIFIQLHTKCTCTYTHQKKIWSILWFTKVMQTEKAPASNLLKSECAECSHEIWFVDIFLLILLFAEH